LEAGGENVQAMVMGSLCHRIMVSHALCAIAESEIRDGDLGRAIKTMETVQDLIADVALLLSNPNGLSPGAIREAVELLGELDGQVASVEAAIADPPGPGSHACFSPKGLQ
jgi:hypothetical protein